jgi:hypothetical protein
MKWEKRGLIYAPDGATAWSQHTAMTPVPIQLTEQVIRVYAGFRDQGGVSRIGYVDVDADEPSRILAVSKEPVLDVGIPGAFDDNGVILGDVVKVDSFLYLFYVGFQLVEKVKFLAFSGLAMSDDGGNSFRRVSQAPVMDRADEGLYIRAIHTAIKDNSGWRVWYATGSEWILIDNKPYPNYHIRYVESKDGLSFPREGAVCVRHQGNEYRIGRPRVYKFGELYRMFYTKGTLDRQYLIGYAESSDGVNWKRMDESVGIGLSSSGWDSQTICYPSLLKHRATTYMFHNGNDMGRSGFGYAVLDHW